MSKIGEMSTITLNNDTIKNAERYAKLHNISISDAIERGVALLLGNWHDKKDATKERDFQNAIAYVKTLKAKGGAPVPANENGLETMAEEKYKL
jgi:hypothetical protein